MKERSYDIGIFEGGTVVFTESLNIFAPRKRASHALAAAEFAVLLAKWGNALTEKDTKRAKLR
jgi:hypothetical protein